MNKKIIFNILYGKEKGEIYQSILKIENSINDSNELYQYFDEIKQMLHHEKSYIKVRGFRLICRLSKWDQQNKVNLLINELLNILNDDKPTNVRQCLMSLGYLIQYKPELSKLIKDYLKEFDYLKFKDTMSPLIKKDIDYLLDI